MLMTTRPMYDLAYEGGFAVGAFNVNNMELTQAIVDACAAKESPVILQISKGARKYANIRFLMKIVEACVEEHPEIPIAVHCDHGDSIELIKQCIADGYTSVMIDGSHSPFEENAKLTAEAVQVAHDAGVVVEGELGMLGGIEEDVVGVSAEEYEREIEKYLTDPDQARAFWDKTHLDSLAVAIGTSHGAYKFTKEPTLAFDRIEAIMNTCPGLPLVMHGSSSVPSDYVEMINRHGGSLENTMGVPEDQIAEATRRYGVCKVNIDTDLRLATTAKVREILSESPEEFDPRKYLGPARDEVRAMVEGKLEMLHSAGKAKQVAEHWRSLGEPMPAHYSAAATA